MSGFFEWLSQQLFGSYTLTEVIHSLAPRSTAPLLYTTTTSNEVPNGFSLQNNNGPTKNLRQLTFTSNLALPGMSLSVRQGQFTQLNLSHFSGSLVKTGATVSWTQNSVGEYTYTIDYAHDNMPVLDSGQSATLTINGANPSGPLAVTLPFHGIAIIDNASGAHQAATIQDHCVSSTCTPPIPDHKTIATTWDPNDYTVKNGGLTVKSMFDNSYGASNTIALGGVSLADTEGNLTSDAKLQSEFWRLQQLQLQNPWLRAAIVISNPHDRMTVLAQIPSSITRFAANIASMAALYQTDIIIDAVMISQGGRQDAQSFVTLFQAIQGAIQANPGHYQPKISLVAPADKAWFDLLIETRPTVLTELAAAGVHLEVQAYGLGSDTVTSSDAPIYPNADDNSGNNLMEAVSRFVRSGMPQTQITLASRLSAPYYLTSGPGLRQPILAQLNGPIPGVDDYAYACQMDPSLRFCVGQQPPSGSVYSVNAASGNEDSKQPFISGPLAGKSRAALPTHFFANSFSSDYGRDLTHAPGVSDSIRLIGPDVRASDTSRSVAHGICREFDPQSNCGGLTEMSPASTPQPTALLGFFELTYFFYQLGSLPIHMAYETGRRLLGDSSKPSFDERRGGFVFPVESVDEQGNVIGSTTYFDRPDLCYGPNGSNNIVSQAGVDVQKSSALVTQDHAGSFEYPECENPLLTTNELMKQRIGSSIGSGFHWGAANTAAYGAQQTFGFSSAYTPYVAQGFGWAAMYGLNYYSASQFLDAYSAASVAAVQTATQMTYALMLQASIIAISQAANFVTQQTQTTQSQSWLAWSLHQSARGVGWSANHAMPFVPILSEGIQYGIADGSVIAAAGVAAAMATQTAVTAAGKAFVDHPRAVASFLSSSTATLGRIAARETTRAWESMREIVTTINELVPEISDNQVLRM